MRRISALLLLTAFLACREAEKPIPPPTPPPPPLDASEKGNLFNMAFGASVVSRTGELTLDNSAIRAVDGDPESMWTSPPADNLQTIVFALPAPARIDQVGAHTPSPKSFAIAKMRFEVSSDGTRFTTVAEPQLKSSEEPQLFPITPVTASYLRVTTTEAPGRFAMLQSVHARGTYASPPAAHPIAGCWTVNGKRAQFTEEKGRISGAIGDATLHGGVDGALYRLIWMRGSEWGYAAITVSPDGKHLSGIKWHEEPIQYDFGESWFGERCSDARVMRLPDIRPAFLQQARRLPLFAGDADLDVVMKLLADGKRVKLAARDHRGVPQEPKVNALRETLRKLGADLTRIDIITPGDKNPRHPIQNELMRSLYGVVEIEP